MDACAHPLEVSQASACMRSQASSCPSVVVCAFECLCVCERVWACANVCERVCACLSSCLPKRVCACTLSVWNVAAAVYFFERSCVPSSGAGVAVMSAQQRTSDETNASGRPSGVAGTRSDMRGHTQGLHTAHLSISRPSTGQSKPASVHLAM